MKLTPEHELTAEPQHPTGSEWNELAAAMTAMGELLTEQMLLLEEIAARPSLWTTREQTAELLREVKEVRRLLEQAGKERARRCSLPKLRLPRPSPEWLLLPAALLGLLVLWYSGTTLGRGLEMLWTLSSAG